MFCDVVPPYVEIRMPSGYPFYKFGLYNTLECPYEGSPEPTVHWEWQPCRDVSCVAVEGAWGMHTESRNVYEPSKVSGRVVNLVQWSDYR